MVDARSARTDPFGQSSRVGVLVAADAHPWEAGALEAIAGAGRHLVLVKRCLDLSDLLATAATGSAQVALVSSRLSGLDADAVDRLAGQGVRVVAVVPERPPSARVPEEEVDEHTRLLRTGVSRVLRADAVAAIAESLLDAADADPPSEPLGTQARGKGAITAEAAVGPAGDGPERQGRLVAVWGPTGAPGRTTVAVGIAAEAAARDSHVTLVDADPYGGTAGQHLAVLEEVSGLLAATRLANSGQLDPAALSRVAREVAPRMRLVTGLPRPDRWVEVRNQAFRTVLATARRLDQLVVVDTGFALPGAPRDPYSSAPGRDDMTAAALAEADDVVVVASADPVGLTRLARSLRDLLDVRPDGPGHVVVNRMRPTLGWSERDICYLVGGVSPGASVTFLPDDRAAADRALVSGRSLVESGDSPLRRGIAAVVDQVLREPAVGVVARRRCRRGR